MNGQTPPALMSIFDTNFQQLKSRVIGLTGLAYYEDKDQALAEHFAVRLKANGISDYAGYLALLTSEGEGRREVEALVAELTIGETFFFRYEEQFDALRDVILPNCIERNKAERRLRIWSAACSTGAEPYSVAILIQELLGDQLPDWHVTILATDINQKFLASARAGLFGDWALRTMTDHRRSALFDDAQGQWLLRKQYRAMVSFVCHNLMSLVEGGPTPDGASDFDIILCRNVLIYFNRETIQLLLPRLADAMSDEGWLLVGPSEPNEDFARVFATVSAPGTTLYRKMPAALPLWSLTPSPPAVTRPPPGARATRPARRPPPARVVPPTALASPVVASPATPSLADLVDLVNRGKWPEARQVCDRRLAVDTMNPLVHYYSALIHQHHGVPTDAEQSYRKAVYLDRGFAMAHFQLGAMLAELGQQDGARKALANVLRALDGVPDDTPLLGGDGMAVAELRGLVKLHLEAGGRS